MQLVNGSQNRQTVPNRDGTGAAAAEQGIIHTTEKSERSANGNSLHPLSLSSVPDRVLYEESDL